MKMKLDERQKNLLYAEVEKEMDAVEMSKEELDAIVGGNLSLKPIKPIIPKPPIYTTMALGEEDDSGRSVSLK